MRVIIYKMADGQAVIGRICRTDGTLAIREGGKRILKETDDELIAMIAESSKPEGAVSWRVADASELPNGKSDGSFDSTFKEALEDNGTIKVNMAKARGIHMGKIRETRNEKLEKLDVEQLKGRDVQAEKQRLRDLPETFDLTLAATPDELKALWPEELK